MSKKIQIGARPTNSAPAPTADAWVESRTSESEIKNEKMKRFTIDVPESLHRAVKLSCVSRGVKIADELRELLTQKYGNQ